MSTPHRLSSRLTLLKNALASNHTSIGERVEAAVGLMLYEQDHDLETLLIQRAERQGDPWSGQIGLPGGRVKDSDGSIKGTLRREVMEEVGIDLEQVGRELGPLSVGQPMRRLEMKVQPWVYAIDKRPTVNIGPEVNSAFWVSLSGLNAKKTTSEVMIRDGWRTVDCFLVDGKVIWGFTYRVLTELLQTPGVIEES
jgi:8-oxo-dGTP pyrophosphatase MutT (NUDIX family)